MYRPILFLLFAAISLSLAERAPDPLLEVDFLREGCVENGVFPVSTGSLFLFSFGSMSPEEKTFTCPVITFEGITYTDASNGFKSVADGALISNLPVPQEAFANDKPEHSFEFFLFVGDFEDTEPFTLIELGRNAFGETLNTWDPESDFLLRIGFSKSNGIIEFFAQFSDAEFLAPILAEDLGKLIHLVITFVRPDPPNSGIVDMNVFLNGAPVVSDSQNIPNTGFLFDNIVDDVFFTVGMSFNSLLEGSGEVTMPYDMHKFAIYDRPLSEGEINNNFLASVANSFPTARDVDIDHLEDIDTVFSFENILATFDFDRDILGIPDELEFVIVAIPDEEIGTVSNLNGEEIELVDVLPLTTLLVFEQAVENLHEGVATIDYFLIQNGLGSERSIGNKKINLIFVEQNDPIRVADNTNRIPENQFGNIIILVRDTDSFSGTNPDFFPQNIIIDGIEIDRVLSNANLVPIGEFVYCEDPTVTIAVGDEIPLEHFFRTISIALICFQSVISDIITGEAAGTASISYRAVDQIPSEVATETVIVLPPLHSGCDIVEGAGCKIEVFEAEVTNGNEIKVELKLFDSHCDDGSFVQAVVVDEVVCAERFANREAIIVGPLPDPESEGVFIYFRNGEANVLVEDDFDENNEFILPDENKREDGVFEIGFRAVDGYFNLSPFPICNLDETSRAGSDDVLFPDRSDCPNFAFSDLIKCFGIFCNEPLGEVLGFSTGILLDDDRITYGSCGTDTTFDGCPIKILTRLKIFDSISPIDEFRLHSQLIWIKNSINSASDRRFDLIPSERTFDIPEGVGQLLNPPIQIDDEEPNGNLVFISFEINNNGLIRIPSIAEFLNVEITSNLALLDADINLAEGVSGGQPSPDNLIAYLIGPSPRINEFLQSLQVDLVSQDTTLTVFIQNPYRAGSGSFRQVEFTFGVEENENQDGDNDNEEDNENQNGDNGDNNNEENNENQDENDGDNNNEGDNENQDGDNNSEEDNENQDEDDGDNNNEDDNENEGLNEEDSNDLILKISLGVVSLLFVFLAIFTLTIVKSHKKGNEEVVTAVDKVDVVVMDK